MREVLRDRNIATILVSTLLLGIGYGISIALTSLHLDAAHFGKEDIGSLAAWFAGGIVLFSIPVGQIVRIVSPKWTLVGALAGYAVVVTLFPHLHAFWLIAAARFFDGAFSVGVWVGSETALLARADPKRKAFVMSLYAVSMAVGYVLGPIIARGLTKVFPTTIAFATSGVLAGTASLVCALRLEPGLTHEEPDAKEGATGEATRAPLFELLRRIRTSCFATFAYGYFQSSTVLFLPLFLIESKGIARDKTILVPAFFAGGMLLFSNVVGRAGDAMGHLFSMRALSVVGVAAILGFVFLDSFAAMGATIFVAGATLACISPLSLALQGIVLEPHELSRANGVYNAFYAAGMLLGPRVSSIIFARYGGPPMLFHIAALWAAFFVFAWVFRTDDPRARGESPMPIKVPAP
ncbi:MAG: MFS transporter [Polyangiaceae bacterium]